MIQTAIVSCVVAILACAVAGFGLASLFYGPIIASAVLMALSLYLFVRRSSDVTPPR